MTLLLCIVGAAAVLVVGAIGVWLYICAQLAREELEDFYN